MSIGVLLTGANGYIGGQALHQLLNNQDDIQFIVTALVRTQAKAEKLEAATSKATNTNKNLIKELVYKNDVIFNTANVDHVSSAQDLTEALQTATSRNTLIHTSGTAVIADDPVSPAKTRSTNVYSDTKNIDEIKTLAPEQLHRPADEIIMDIHDKNSQVITAIVSPSNVVGISDGYDKIISVQVPELIRFTKANGKGLTLYSGDYIWNHIHIRDLGELYYLILQKISNNTPIPLNRAGHYFGSYYHENEDTPTTELTSIEHTWIQLAEYVAQRSYERKCIINDWKQLYIKCNTSTLSRLLA